MRKFYPPVVGLLICLVTLKTYSQENLVIPENSLKTNTIHSSSINERQNAPGVLEFYGNEIAGIEKANFTCQADFEISPTPNSPLYKKFTAIPGSSEQKKPVYICWTFGDGKDTCIQYSNTSTGPYPVVHFYQLPGNYEVCVRIVYDGGCEAKNCKLVVIEKPTECKADFERIPVTSADNPLAVSYKALPWINNDKKPKQICWKFGDGKDTCINYPENFTGQYAVRHEYHTPGNYEVCIVILYYGGCEAKNCKVIHLEAPDECRADFEKIPAITTINPFVAIYKALPWHNNNKKPKEICWRFGDGKDTCITYPENYTGTYQVRHEYKQAGNYEVCVKIIYQGGCESYKCKAMLIGRPDECKVDFERIPENTASHPLLAYFRALTAHNNNKKPKQICWKFGDGKDTCITYPENYTGTYIGRHEYKEPGTYEVCVKILYYGGCEAYSCKRIIISRPDECKADFERIPENTANHPLLAYYKALTAHNNNKKPKQICWKFGDGKDTCITYPENYIGAYIGRHEYKEPGTYEVCVKILYYGGCEAYSCKKIIINRPDECKADFERIENTANNPLLAYYKALTAHNNNKKPKQICWKFGDGKDTCITYPEDYTGTYIGRHEYKEPGTYEVCVKILYYGGCEANICKKIIISRPDECKADFERIPENTANHPLLAYFRALTVHNNNKKPKQICWKFGDGKDTCINYPENYIGTYIGRHEYKEPGTYEVCVKILYYGGCEANICKRIIFSRPDECKADFERIPENTANHPLLAYYRALTAHNNNKKPKQICWKFGDGKDTCITYLEDYTGTYIGRHEYRERGRYEVCVSILYYGGCESKNCKLIQIGTLDECKAGFERLTVSSTANPLVAYLNALTGHSNNNKPKQICWKFGDGKDTCITYPENFTGNYVVRHEYHEPHDYEVCIVIQYYGGCEAKKCGIVKVTGQEGCTVKISELLNPVIPGFEKGFAVSYYTPNNKRPLRICWNFGDGKDTCIELSTSPTLSQLSTRHNYNTPGVYKTCIRVVFDGGCVAENCLEVVVKPASNGCGGYMTNTLVSTRTIKFKAFAVNNAGDPVLSYHWIFGDGSSADGAEVTHTYKEQNTYEVCLLIKTQSGCETRICKKFIVQDNDRPVLQLSPNPVVSTVHLLFYSTHTETVSIKIVNSNGTVVRSYTRNAVTGSNNWDLDLSTLNPGTYIIYIQSPNQMSSQLFIKN